MPAGAPVGREWAVAHYEEASRNALQRVRKYALSRGFGFILDAAIVAGIILPVAIAALLSLVLMSNLLKWLLKRHEKPMGGLLLGVLWGSALAIWPFTTHSTPGEWGLGLLAMLAGFAVVLALTLLGPRKGDA